MKTKHLLHLLGLALPLCVLPARADTISFSVNYHADNLGNSGNFTSLGDQSPISLPQFDPAQGTLDSVTLSISGTLSGTSLVEINYAGSDLSWDVWETGNDSLLLGSDTLVTLSLATQRVTVLAPGTGGPLGGIYVQTSLPDMVVIDSTNHTWTGDAAFLNQFIGTGTITPTTSLTNSTADNLQGDAGSNAGYVGYRSGVLAMDAVDTVTYNYTPASVPEPSSWLLTSICGIALLGLRRRSRLV